MSTQLITTITEYLQKQLPDFTPEMVETKKIKNQTLVKLSYGSSSFTFGLDLNQSLLPLLDAFVSQTKDEVS
jgi:hypothetical protein